MNKKIFCFFLITGCFLNLNVEAQDFKRADSFFKHGEAGSPLTHDRQDNDITNSEKNKDNITKDKLPVKTDNKMKDKTPEILPGLKENDANKGKQIVSFGAILDGTNKKHFEQCVKTLLEVSDKYKFDLDKIYVTAFLDVAGIEIIDSLVKRGATVPPVAAPPEEYNVTASPTWIIQTEDGRIVLEGVEDPGRYINSRGEFVSKAQKSSIIEDKAPEQQMKSFFADEEEAETFKKGPTLEKKAAKSFF